MKNKKILITGGTGFIGIHLINKLKKSGVEIINISHHKKIDDVENINVDLKKTDFSFLDNLDFDYVIHLAAFSSPKRSKNKEETIELNVNATRRFLEKVGERKVKKIIFLSSALVYAESNNLIKEEDSLNKNLIDIYTKSKILGEKICLDLKEKGLPILIFRLSNGYGPGQQWEGDSTLIPQLISQAILNNKISLFNRRQIRDYIYIDDIVDAIIRALNTSFSGVLNLGTGKGTSSGDIAERIFKLTGTEIENLNYKIIGPEKIILDISKINEVLNWRPKIRIEEGLNKTIKYYKKLLEK